MGSLYRRKKKDRTTGGYYELPTWWLKYRQNGRVVSESSGTKNKVVARRMLEDRVGDVAKGIPIVPKMGTITFEKAVALIENDYKAKDRKSLDGMRRRVRLGLAPVFGDRLMAQISTGDITAFVVHRREQGASNATINRELAYLKRMYRLAIRAKKLHDRPHWDSLPENNARQGFFEREQFEEVCRLLPAPLQPLVRFGFITGWRMRSEVFPLQWRQVDWDERMVRLEPGTTKNGEGRQFPFTRVLEELLLAQWAEHERHKKAGRVVPWVFHRDGARIRVVYRAWRTACKRAGYPGRKLHDFRRTAVRRLELAGVPRKAGMKMVGHKTASMYDRYMITDERVMREAADKIDDVMTAEASEGRVGTLSGTPEAHRAPRRSRLA